MSDRIHVTMTLDLFVEDGGAMREAAFERLRGAWSSDEDFPYESETDVPLDQVVHSLIADALPADLPGCRRSQLEVRVETRSSDGPQAASRDDSDAASTGKGADDSDAEPKSPTSKTDDPRDSASNQSEGGATP